MTRDADASLLADFLNTTEKPSTSPSAGDYRVGAEVFAIARLVVVVFVQIYMTWVGGPTLLPVTVIVAVALAFHFGWWSIYIRGSQTITIRVVIAAAMGDVVLTGVGTIYCGGVRSPAVMIWAITIALAASWIGFRRTLPMMGVVIVFSLGNGLGWIPTQMELETTPLQDAVWNIFVLILIMSHVAMGGVRQRHHARALMAAEALARRDALTGLGNRTLLTEQLEELIPRAHTEGRPLAVAIIDLDDFKQVNDTHGHMVGDQVLVSVADQLRAQVRPHDLPVRLGGEEFVVVMPDATAATAAALVERVRRAVATCPTAMRTTLSAGVAELHPVHRDGWALLAVADQALYDAKRSGKDRTEIATRTVVTVPAVPTFAAPASGVPSDAELGFANWL